MKLKFTLFSILLLTIIFSVLNCEKLETGKDITSLSVTAGGVDYIGVFAGNNITFNNKVPYGTTQVEIKTLTLSNKAVANIAIGATLNVSTTTTITITAEDNTSTSYEVVIQAEDPSEKPTVISLGNVKNITINSATMSGTLINIGTSNITEYGHVWGTGEVPTLTGAGVSKSILGANISAGHVFSTFISGLSENTHYYVRSYASNNIGTSYGDIKPFVTLQLARLRYMTDTDQTTFVISGNGINYNMLATSNVISLGSNNITQHGHVYSTSAQNENLVLDGENVMKTTLGAKTEIGDFISTLIDLNTSTTYYIRPYIVTIAGIVYGIQNSFTTSAGLPEVTIGSASLSLNNITISGSIADLGGSNASLEEHGHIWNTTNENLTTALTTKTTKGKSIQSSNFESTTANLTKNTTYYFKAYVTNNIGTGYSAVKSFKTLNDETDITHLTIKNIRGESTYIQTKSMANETITGTTIVFTGIPYYNTQAAVHEVSVSEQASVTFNSGVALTGGSVLNIGTNNVSVIASAGNTKEYTIILETEPPIATTVKALSATNITLASATLQGQITDFGISPLSGYGFRYYDTSGNIMTVYSDNLDTNTGIFTADITELMRNTSYSVVAFATNHAGESNTTDSSSTSFITKNYISPTVNTLNASDISSTSATLNGEVTDTGNNPISGYGFIYSESIDASLTLTGNGTRISVGSNIGVSTFNRNIDDLNTNTPYYYTTYATNMGGTTYGQTRSFTTIPDASKAITAMVITENGNTYSATISGTTATFINIPYGTPEVTISTLTLSSKATADTNEGDILTVSGTSTIVVTAEDNSTATYTITINTTPASTEKAITAMVVTIDGDPYTGTISGTNITFPNTIPYGLTEGTISILTLSQFATSDTNEGDTLTVSGTNTIVVTAQDNSTVTYTITINTIPASTEKAITAMVVTIDGTPYTGTISGTNITFPNTIPYGLTEGTISTLTLSQFATSDTNEGDTLTVSGTSTIVVTAQDNSTATYTIIITTAPPSSQKDITEMAIRTNNQTYTGTISGMDITFSNDIPYATQVTISTLRLSQFATADTNEGDTLTVSGTSTIVVTAQDNSTVTYTITINTIPPSTQKAITAMDISAGGNMYTATISGTSISFITLPYGITEVTISTLMLSQFATADTNEGDTLTVSGTNTIVVTAQDNSTASYTVTLGTVPPSTQKAITAMDISAGGNTYTATISGTSISFITLPYGITEVTISTLRLSQFATADINEGDTLTVSGTNTIVVTAQDNSTATYTVTLDTFVPSTQKAITAMSISAGGNTYTPTISGTSISFITLPYGITEVTISTLTLSQFATADTNEGDTLAVSGTSTIVVTAQDSSTATYTVVLGTVPPSTQKAITAMNIFAGGITYPGTIVGTNITFSGPPYATSEVTISTLTLSQFATADINEDDTLTVSGTSTIVVTAQDNSTVTYTITINTIPASTEKDISFISFSISGRSTKYGTTINGTLITSDVIPKNISEISISGISISALATASATAGSTLAVSNSSSIVVTAEDGSTKTYSIHFRISGERYPAEDFNTLKSAGNRQPHGIWSNGMTMWVADYDDAKLYAYNLATKARDPDKDINNLTDGNEAPRGLWSNGTTIWTSDQEYRELYAYNISTGAYQLNNSFRTLHNAHNWRPDGIWSNGTTVWVTDELQEKLFAYRFYNKSRDAGKDIDLYHENPHGALVRTPRGLWSDGTTIWVVDSHYNKVYAYNLATKTLDASKNITLGDVVSPRGVWSDRTTIWIVDSFAADKIYAYNLPVD